ncbi:mitochondrial dicarboxylate carrier [Ascobolus immersus RN42]|uniref:Mitochondrial dicarboxylate carrier n=1 Tax=Ascobolus immersus RN42 TaxID=1160509 RepID=A0A3N4HK56_ASCIM|nr:mitochondrial dicarboxylate carrier [Ascobolus immersus RN42]
MPLFSKPTPDVSVLPPPSGILSHPTIRTALPFLNGGAAGMLATTLIQPIDMIKVRIQLHPTSITPLAITRQILASGRPLDLYSGLSAGLLRQAVYTTARMGFFGTFMSHFSTKAKSEGRGVSFGERAVASLSAGGLGAVLGNPADLALIRMQSDGLRPVAEQQRYKNVANALTRIAKAEGVTALWGGCTPTVLRAMALNFGQLAFYSEAKSRMDKAEVTKNLNPALKAFGASAVAGFFASFFSLPFDFVKTRLQKGGQYRGVVDCVTRTIREEGVMRFYRGFGTYYFRIAPHAMLTVLFADEFAKLTRAKI